MPVVNTVASLRSQLQQPTMSNRGVPVSFVDMNMEPSENPDAPPPMPDMPDKIPDHINPAPDAPEEDEDDRLGESEVEMPLQEFNARMGMALAKIREGYIELSNLLAGN